MSKRASQGGSLAPASCRAPARRAPGPGQERQSCRLSICLKPAWLTLPQWPRRPRPFPLPTTSLAGESSRASVSCIRARRAATRWRRLRAAGTRSTTRWRGRSRARRYPSTEWRRRYSLLLGLERVLSEDEPRLEDARCSTPTSRPCFGHADRPVGRRAERRLGRAARSTARPCSRSTTTRRTKGRGRGAARLEPDSQRTSMRTSSSRGPRTTPTPQALLVRARDRRRQNGRGAGFVRRRAPRE